MTAHETIRRSPNVELGSNRVFGLIFSVVFLLIGLWPLLDQNPVRAWSLWIALLVIIPSIIRPKLLKPLNRTWFLIGLILHKIFNPIIMALLFYLTITPIALLMKLFKKRPLGLEFDDTVESYWVHRSPPGPKPETMKNQF